MVMCSCYNSFFVSSNLLVFYDSLASATNKEALPKEQFHCSNILKMSLIPKIFKILGLILIYFYNSIQTVYLEDIVSTLSPVEFVIYAEFLNYSSQNFILDRDKVIHCIGSYGNVLQIVIVKMRQNYSDTDLRLPDYYVPKIKKENLIHRFKTVNILVYGSITWLEGLVPFLIEYPLSANNIHRVNFYADLFILFRIEATKLTGNHLTQKQVSRIFFGLQFVLSINTISGKCKRLIYDREEKEKVWKSFRPNTIYNLNRIKQTPDFYGEYLLAKSTDIPFAGTNSYITSILKDPGIYQFRLIVPDIMALLYLSIKLNASFLACPGINMQINEGTQYNEIFEPETGNLNSAEYLQMKVTINVLKSEDQTWTFSSAHLNSCHQLKSKSIPEIFGSRSIAEFPLITRTK